MLAGISEIRLTTVYAHRRDPGQRGVLMFGPVAAGQAGVVLGLLGGFVPFYFIGEVYQSIRILRVDVLESQFVQET